MLQLLSAQLRRHAKDNKHGEVPVERVFPQLVAYAFVWGFGGELRPAERGRFQASIQYL